MAEDRSTITESIFINNVENYNTYNNIDDYSKNEALTIDKEGKVQYREVGKFKADDAIMIDTRNVLKFRTDNKLELKKNVTKTSDFMLSGGVEKDENSENKPKFIADSDSNKEKNDKIYKVGNYNVNVLRSLNNKDQQV